MKIVRANVKERKIVAKVFNLATDSAETMEFTIQSGKYLKKNPDSFLSTNITQNYPEKRLLEILSDSVHVVTYELPIEEFVQYAHKITPENT